MKIISTIVMDNIIVRILTCTSCQEVDHVFCDPNFPNIRAAIDQFQLQERFAMR